MLGDLDYKRGVSDFKHCKTIIVLTFGAENASLDLLERAVRYPIDIFARLCGSPRNLFIPSLPFLSVTSSHSFFA